MRRIYLDNNATTPVAPEVVAAIEPYWSERFGNASSLHQEGQRAKRALEEARERVAERLDAAPSQVFFTSGGTESNNLALFGLSGSPPGRLVTSSIEHPSVLGCFAELEQRGFEVVRLPVSREGIVAAADFQEVVQGARLASVMLVNNETGALQPVAELAQIARAAGVGMHSDAAQAVGRIQVSFRRLGIDALSSSAHKFHGPGGVGLLVVRDPSAIEPLLRGGHQEAGVRPGTEPVALAVGLACALDLALERLEQDRLRISELRDRLEEALTSRIPDLKRNGPRTARAPNTSNLSFPGRDGQALMVALDLAGVACSTGSACASGAPEPSHVLLAMGLEPDEVRSSLRFSLSRLTTDRDIEEAVARIVSVLDKRSAAAPVLSR